MSGKNRRKEVKKRFFINKYIVTKKFEGKKRAKQFFHKNTNDAIKKFWEKPSQICAKNVFLYSHKYRDQKMGEKSAKQFFQKHTNGALKKCWEKTSQKCAK